MLNANEEIKGITISEARNRLTQLPEELGQSGWMPLTRHGQPVMALVAWDLFEAIQETMEIMADPDMVQALRESIEELQQGKTIPWEQARAELDAIL